MTSVKVKRGDTQLLRFTTSVAGLEQSCSDLVISEFIDAL